VMALSSSPSTTNKKKRKNECTNDCQ
jgi:hypothetical protein